MIVLNDKKKKNYQAAWEGHSGKLTHNMENYKITCYIPGSELNLFKIKSICSFHTLCSTSLQQSTVEYSVTLKLAAIMIS